MERDFQKFQLQVTEGKKKGRLEKAIDKLRRKREERVGTDLPRPEAWMSMKVLSLDDYRAKRAKMRQEEQQAIDDEVRKRAEEQAAAAQETKQKAEQQKAEEIAARKRQDAIDQDEMMDLAVSQIVEKDKLCRDMRGLFDDFIVAVDENGKIVEEKLLISAKTQKEQDQEELDRACVEA